MAQRGGISHINYKETRGLKIGSGQSVRKGSILTRQGGKWKAGLNVRGRATLYAFCDGNVYFSKKRGSYRTRKLTTLINVNPLKEKRSKQEKPAAKSES